MRSFNNFATDKTLREFHSYLESESRQHPEAFQMFVDSLPRLQNELFGWGRKKQQQQGTDANPIPLQPVPQGHQDNPIPLQQAQNDKTLPIAASGGKPAVYPGQNNPNMPIAAGGGKPAVYPGQNDKTLPMAAGGGKPAVYPGQGNNQNLPMGQEIDDGTGSKAASDAMNKLFPNIIKTAQQKNPSNVQAVQQAVNAFQAQWKQFKQQIPQLLGAQGVKNPQKHGLTYGLAPQQ